MRFSHPQSIPSTPLSSVGEILATVGSWGLENDMHTIEAFIQDPETKQIHRCQLKITLSSQAEIDAVKAEHARQHKNIERV